MFTGLIQGIGTIVGLDDSDSGHLRLRVYPGSWAHRAALEESISVSGCCLTIARPYDDAEGCFDFDVVPESLARTKLSSLKLGDRVNLEHACTPSTLLGGHIVQGHVDAVGTIVHNGPSKSIPRPVKEPTDQHATTPAVSPSANTDGWELEIMAPAPLRQYLTPKGSVAVDGVSLTIARLIDTGFTVALIPTTLKETTLGDLKKGDRVNLEADILSKTLIHWAKNTMAGNPALLADAIKTAAATPAPEPAQDPTPDESLGAP